ncbi:S8 family peptidase [Microcoleus sp. AS-A8]
MLESLQKSHHGIRNELYTPATWQLPLQGSEELTEPIQLRQFSQSSSFNTAGVTDGSLDSTDPTNPNRSGTFRDDYLLTNLVAGQLVQLNLNSAAFDAYLQVVNANTGEVIAYNDDFNSLNSQLTLTTQAGIDYIVRATSYGSSAIGAYSLVSNNGNLTAATSINPNQTFSGTLVTTDPANSLRAGSLYDGYLLTNLVAGQQVQVNLNSGAFDAYLQIVNASTGEVVVQNDDANGTLNSQVNFTAQTGVNYIARATSFAGAATGAYTLTTSSAEAFSGTLDSTDPTNPTRTGTFRDDYLLTNLVAGQSVQLNLNSPTFDAYLQVVNAATGEVVAENDNFSGTNSQLTFTTQAEVDYIVRATSSALGATGAYSLVTNNGDLTSATPISGSQTFSGTLVNSDPANSLRPGSYYDGYLLTNLTVGQAVQVNMNSAFDAYLQVVNADTGQIVAFNDDAKGRNSQLAFIVESGVDYIVRATSYGASVTGNYTLTTQSFTLPEGYNLNYGYGLVDAAAAVASADGQDSAFADVDYFGGQNDWGLNMVKAPEAWAQGFTGEGIVVAVIDTGVDYTHLDLDGNIWVNEGEIAGNGIDDDDNGFVDDVRGWDFVANDNNPMDEQGHGTHVAGTIAAEKNDFGVTGVAYNAKIMAVRVLDAGGSGSVSNIAAGIRYAADNGADVINLSLGGGYSSEEEDAIEYATAKGSVVVMAAGNESASQPSYPANLANQWGIAVGAVDSTNTMANFSNKASIPPLDYVVAPGVNIYSTTPGNTYSSFNGTSMATPHVAGVAALMLSANPNLTPAEVESILTKTANPTGITV